jgi:hypothetical protein
MNKVKKFRDSEVYVRTTKERSDVRPRPEFSFLSLIFLTESKKTVKLNIEPWEAKPKAAFS